MTVLQSSVSKTAAFNGTGVDVSGLATYGTFKINVTALTAGKTAVFAIQSSADNFVSDIKTEKTFQFVGGISSINPAAQVAHEYDMPNIRLGVASAKVRVALLSIDAAGTVVYEAYLQQ